jgi:possible transcriptional regulator
LTARELDVLRGVARAWTNAEIAEHLVVGVATVKTYISRLITKLGVRDRVGLAVWAHQNGIT